jgi:hypothetical protein
MLGLSSNEGTVMRRYVLFVVALAPLIGVGCEDGPNQTYSPAPPGAGAVWNGPPATGGIKADGGAYVPGATQGYDGSVGGTNANERCTGPQEKDIWKKYFNAPILPPGLGAGLDMAGGVNSDGIAGYTGDPTKFAYDATKETWTGVTVEQAEALLCQGTADSIYYGVTNTIGWGEQLEVSALYNTNSRIITDLIFTTGYNGTVTATSTDKSTTYTFALNQLPIQMTTATGTQSLLFDWNNTTDLQAKVNALWDALRNTFAQNVAPEPDCIATGHCKVYNFGGSGGAFWFVPINFTFYVNQTIGSSAVQSTPILIDLGLLKLLPFSLGGSLLKMDAKGEGPVLAVPNVGGTGKNCKYVLGMNFGDFDANCVEPFPANDPANNNLINTRKLFGAMAHGDEAYAFDIAGVDPQFAATLATTAVVADGAKPAANDVAYSYRLDEELLGPIANDYTGNDITQKQDWHGSGMVELEWANLVQQYMKANYGVTSDLGDPACIANAASPGVAGKVCSGIEGIVTAAPPSLAPASMAVNALGAAADKVDAKSIGIGLKPGTWYSTFCTDGGGLDSTTGKPVGYKKCSGSTSGSYFFDNMQGMVAAVYSAAGQPVPSTLANRRFYFQQWMFALIKYLQTADNPSATLAQIDANPIDPNELFFDSNGGGFETAEYVFRGTVNSSMQAPTALDVTTALTTSIMNDIEFVRYNFRGEKALYSALQTKSTDQPGAEPLYLSNIVGSPVLASTYSTYACATNLDPKKASCANSSGVVNIPPTDASGKSIFTGYSPAFGASILNIPALGSPNVPSPMTVSSSDFTLIQSAMVTLPILSDPYNPQSAKMTDPTVSALLPFVPKGANVGFPVTIDGSRDKFYNTNVVDFTGSTIDAFVDYEYVNSADSQGNITTNLVVRAVESSTYLGYVFACAEPNPTTGNMDVLAIRMYTNGQDILDWISAHPTATADCNVQIKYSPYGNYADFISFLSNGVRLGLNPGFGGSVVSDATLFDPNVVGLLGQ